MGEGSKEATKGEVGASLAYGFDRALDGVALTRLLLWYCAPLSEVVKLGGWGTLSRRRGDTACTPPWLPTLFGGRFVETAGWRAEVACPAVVDVATKVGPISYPETSLRTDNGRL